MFNTDPAIRELRKMVKYRNPISGHEWFEEGAIIGYEVLGGGWMRSRHRTLKAAEKELALRNKICAERVEKGKSQNIT